MRQYRKVLCLGVVSTAMLSLLAIPVVARLPTATLLGVAKDTSGGVPPITTRSGGRLTWSDEGARARSQASLRARD